MHSESSPDENPEEQHRFICGRCLTLWASRHYVRSRLDFELLPAAVTRELQGSLRLRLRDTIIRVWDILISYTNQHYVLHEPNSGLLSKHEAAVFAEINGLLEGRYHEFGIALIDFLSPSAIARIESDIRSLAQIIHTIDQTHDERPDRIEHPNTFYIPSAQNQNTLH